MFSDSAVTVVGDGIRREGLAADSMLRTTGLEVYQRGC